MVFTTRFYTKSPEPALWPTVLLVLLVVGCSPARTDFGFTIERVEARNSAGLLDVTVNQAIILSAEAKKALDHGVPLAIQTDFALREAGSHRDIDRQTRVFEIRYLPLSKRYQLTTGQPPDMQTFPRLRHLLAEIQVVNFVMPAAGLASGEFELRARSHLEKNLMPAPMRLPMWFSSQWQHDSGWQSWPVSIQPKV